MADRYRDDDRYRRERGGEDWRERDDRWRGGTSDRDRGFVHRASDEVRSWFGDEDAERRREGDRQHENEMGRGDDRWRGREERDYRERAYRPSAETEWRDRERERQRDQSYGGPSSLNRERDFGRTDRYANTDEGVGYGTRSYGGGGYGDAYGVDRGSRDYRGTSGYASRSSAAFSTSNRYGWNDEYPQGPHSGRGPRAYRRSDERIREDVCERLTRHGRIDATDIDVRVENGQVTLEGSVDNRETKRLAEDVADDVFGVRDVNNQLKVHRGDMPPVGTAGRHDIADESGGTIGTVMKGMTGTEDPTTSDK